MIELDIICDGKETVTISDPENALENVNISTHIDNCNGGQMSEQILNNGI